jgi:hypothetical protein
MIGFKKRYTNDLLKTIARQQGVSVAEVRSDLQVAIEMARNNPDPQTQEKYRKYFGNRTPTPEEFIYTMTKELGK